LMLPSLRHKLEIGPGAQRLLFGQPLAQVAQGGYFPGISGFGDGYPVLGHHGCGYLLEAWYHRPQRSTTLQKMLREMACAAFCC
jgi:hypothetical protein